jgi:hypothetical protein
MDTNINITLIQDKMAPKYEIHVPEEGTDDISENIHLTNLNGEQSSQKTVWKWAGKKRKLTILESDISLRNSKKTRID